MTLHKLPQVILCYLTVCVFTSFVHAQNSAFDEIPISGLATYEQLRKEYYIGGLYLEPLATESDMSLNFQGKKRMDLRITINKWSARRFTKQWNQAILINNDQESLETFADQVLAFTKLPKDDLVAGDRITIDMDPDAGTTVYINGNTAIKVKDNAFFDVLLNVWVGQRPPSSDFKNNILTLNTEQEGTNLLARYQATIPTSERKEKLAGWYNNNTKPKKVVEPKQEEIALIAPDSETAVTAKRGNTQTTNKIDIKISDSNTDMAAPNLELNQPMLAPAINNPAISTPVLASSAPTAAVESIAQSEPPKPMDTAPKKSDITLQKPAQPDSSNKKKVASPAADDSKQQKLLKTYAANIRKLTFLNTRYPSRASRAKQEGTVILKLVLNRQGKLDSLTTVQSSEKRLLDKAALSAVNKTAPYPEAPKDLKGKTFDVTIPFKFQL